MHTIVSRAVEVAGHSVTVVLGAHAGELAPLLKHSPATITVNREWSEGIASSIREGLAHTPATADGVMILLADQAAVTTEDLRRLASAWRRNPLRSPPRNTRAESEFRRYFRAGVFASSMSCAATVARKACCSDTSIAWCACPCPAPNSTSTVRKTCSRWKWGRR